VRHVEQPGLGCSVDRVPQVIVHASHNTPNVGAFPEYRGALAVARA
jgi:hypothetical protein